MRSQRPREVLITKIIGEGDMPAFLPMIHHHFQKSKPVTGTGEYVTVTAPLDQLEMTGIPASLLNQIDSLEITYRRRPTW